MSLPETISLRVSLTDACQFRCRYCRPRSGPCTPAGPRTEPKRWIHLIGLMNEAVPVAKLRFTGGEPLLYRGLPELIRGCAALGLDDIAITTNGLRLTGMAHDLKANGLNRLNISLDSLDPQTFHHLTLGRLDRVLAGLDTALEAGFKPVKLNTVVIRGLNDHEVCDLLAFSAKCGCHIRFLELMPIGELAASFNEQYVSGREVMKRVAECFALEPLPYERGGTSRDFRFTDRRGRSGRCGFILPSSTPFCDGCRRLRLCADGRLAGCLARPERLTLDRAWAEAERGRFEPLREQIRSAMMLKQKPYAFENQQAMVAIGG